MKHPLHYVVEELAGSYLSRETLVELGSLPEYFPMPPPRREYGEVPVTWRRTSHATRGLSRQVQHHHVDCGCPIRVEAPDPPEMPHPATDEFMEKNDNFLRQYYGASSFNCCKHQSLPKMQGPALQVPIREGVEPHAVYTVLPIPVHWEKKVKADIFRDVELAVLERVPENTPVTWCHRMVVCRKHNGDPRRTVDLKKLNDASVRQTHPTQPPLKQEMTVPPGQRKTTLDAWNWYHSVDIREEDRHLTTFLMPLGRFRYKSAPQGYLASGDAYTNRYDWITVGFENIPMTRFFTSLTWRRPSSTWPDTSHWLAAMELC